MPLPRSVQGFGLLFPAAVIFVAFFAPRTVAADPGSNAGAQKLTPWAQLQHALNLLSLPKHTSRYGFEPRTARQRALSLFSGTNSQGPQEIGPVEFGNQSTGVALETNVSIFANTPLERKPKRPAEDANGYVSREELQQRARKFAKDGTIIMLVCNYGYHDFFLNWVLYAQKAGMDKHFLAIAEDASSFSFVSQRWPGHAVRLHVPQIEAANPHTLKLAGLDRADKKSASKASTINSPEFKLIMYRRLFYIRMLMDSGVDVLLSDVDIVLTRSPFPYFKGDYDLYGVIEVQDDVYFNQLNTVQMSPKSSMYLCGGFLLFRGTPRGYLILDHVIMNVFRTTVQSGQENDQTFLRVVLINLWDLPPGLRVGVLPQQLFPPGWLFFGSKKWRSANRGRVVMVHNNWIRRKACKMQRWLKYGLWRVPASVNMSALGVPGGGLGGALEDTAKCSPGTGIIPLSLTKWQAAEYPGYGRHHKKKKHSKRRFKKRKKKGKSKKKRKGSKQH